MGVAMRGATHFEAVTRSDTSDITTSTIDHSNVSLPVVPCGKYHSVSFFKLLLASLFASCVTHFFPMAADAADDFTPLLIWKTTSGTAHNGPFLEDM